MDTIKDMAQRLKAVSYQDSQILKQCGHELAKFYFVCKGSLELSDRKCNEDGGQQYPIVLRSFEVGQSVGDPLLNCNAPISSELKVPETDAWPPADTKLLFISTQDYLHVFRDNKMKAIIDRRL